MIVHFGVSADDKSHMLILHNDTHPYEELQRLSFDKGDIFKSTTLMKDCRGPNRNIVENEFVVIQHASNLVDTPFKVLKFM